MLCLNSPILGSPVVLSVARDKPVCTLCVLQKEKGKKERKCILCTPVLRITEFLLGSMEGVPNESMV